MNLDFTKIREAYAARRDPEGVRALLRLYWHVILMFALSAIILGIMYGTWELSLTLGALSDTSTSESKQTPMLDRQQLEQVLGAFSTKEGASKEMSTTTSSDPSH